MSYIIIPTILNIDHKDGDNIFNINPGDFGTIKSVLKSIGTVDKRIIEEFSTANIKTHNGTNSLVSLCCSARWRIMSSVRSMASR